MNNKTIIDLSSVNYDNLPFPHFYSASVLQNKVEKLLYDWFENAEIWNLTKEDFYEQYELDFLNNELPENLKCLIDDTTIYKIAESIKTNFNINELDLVGIVAHKLIDGQRIGIHNDFIDYEETHRLVIHINPHWQEKNGGILMLFNSSEVKDVAKMINPINNSGFSFEISVNSHHAVSRIYDYSRYTLIYTFKKRSNEFV